MEIHCDRHSDLVRGVDGGEVDGVWKSVPLHSILREPKTVLKIKLMTCLLCGSFALLKLLVNPASRSQENTFQADQLSI